MNRATSSAAIATVADPALWGSRRTRGGMLTVVDSDGPTDAELLAAGGWAGVPGACILAKGWDGDFCVAVVNTHGGSEERPYFTIVECFERSAADGAWSSLGHDGPISRRSGGSGSYDMRWSYEYGWSEADSCWWVIAADES